MTSVNRDEAIATVIKCTLAAGAALFTSNGNNSRAAHALGDHPLIFYAMGSMGQCAALAAGYCAVSGRAVVALDGDGAAAMGLAGMPLVAAAVRAPFVHVVLDNGVYETTGGQRVPVPFKLLTAAAAASGYEAVRTVTDRSTLGAELSAALNAGMEPCAVFLHVRTAPSNREMYPRVPFHPRAITDRFMAADAASMPGAHAPTRS